MTRKDLLYDATVCIAQGRPWAGYAAPRHIAEQALAEQFTPGDRVVIHSVGGPHGLVTRIKDRLVYVQADGLNEDEPMEPTRLQLVNDCVSCGEQMPRAECPESKRACGHHCDHSWSHDHCDWCGTSFGEGGEESHA